MLRLQSCLSRSLNTSSVRFQFVRDVYKRINYSIQLKNKETKVAPIEDPEVVPPTQEEGDQSKVAPSEVPEVVPPAPRDEPKISSSMRRVAFSRVFGREKIH